MLTDPHQEAQVPAIRKSAERVRAGKGTTDQVHRSARYTETIAENAEIFTKGCVSTGIPTIWKVPLDQKPVPASVMYRSYSFSKRSGLGQHHKVIMLVGATGGGKSTLIDLMINYILKVDWKDGFRFKIIAQQGEGPQSQAHSQTQVISSYTIYGNQHHNVPYTLTIIDTPGFGDTRGIEHDRAIVDQIRDFFLHSEDHIDAIGFVAQSSQARLTRTQQYVFDSILSVFGKDISPNILLLVTFCDGQKPPVFDAIKEAGFPCSDSMFKFNNSALFARYVDKNMDDEDNFDRMFWRMGMKSMSNFFQALNSLEPRSLVLTKEVLEERKRLETNLMDLQPQIKKGVRTLEEVQQVHQILEQHETEMQTNESLSQVIKKLSEEFLTVQKRVCFLIIDSHRILMRLEQIALKPNPLSTVDYVDLLIESERSEAKTGWISRIKALEGVRNQADILAKVNQENYDPFENYEKEFLGTTESKSWFKY